MDVAISVDLGKLLPRMGGRSGCIRAGAVARFRGSEISAVVILREAVSNGAHRSHVGGRGTIAIKQLPPDLHLIRQGYVALEKEIFELVAIMIDAGSGDVGRIERALAADLVEEGGIGWGLGRGDSGNKKDESAE